MIKTELNKIKANLTNDKQANINYLRTEMNVQKALGNNELVMAITQLMFDFLPDKVKESYDFKAHELLKSREDDYKVCCECIEKGLLKEAKDILDTLLITYEKVLNNAAKNYFDFDQMIEYAIYTKSIKNANDLKVKRCPEQVTYFYYQYANILEQENNLTRAIEKLIKALRYNPVSSYILEYLVLLMYKTNDLRLFDALKYSLKFAYTKEHFAFYYSLLGDYFKSIKLYNEAIICYASADYFDKEKNKQKIIDLIKEHQVEKNIELSSILALMNRYDLCFGPNIEVINSIDNFSRFLIERNDFDEVINLQHIKYELLEDQEILDYIDKVKSIKNKYIESRRND